MMFSSSVNTFHTRADILAPVPAPVPAPAFAPTLAPEQGSSSRRRREDSTDYAEVGEIPRDYSTLSNRRSYEICREDIELDEMLGVGQFGDVFRGIYTSPNGEKRSVAVKTCKLDNELSTADKFLAEARRMEEFNHPHIIQLIGVCSAPPVYIIMELAPLGELRTYLREHEAVLSVSKLITYCLQIGLALSYLHFKKCVHRDVAARNVLVTSGDCCKLADFGLSRWVDDQAYYTASKGKMPIKWMAPESINFRKFTHQSDVWMYGVCMWEILSFGQKPFLGVDNAEIIGRLERGERLPLPEGCPMTVYGLMVACWAYSPAQRPTFHDLTLQLKLISSNVDSPSSDRPPMMRGGRLKQRTYSCDQLMLDEAPPKPCRSFNNLISTSPSDLLSSNQSFTRPTNERQGRSSTMPRRHSNVTSAHCDLIGLEGAACWDVTQPGTYLQDSFEARLIRQQYESEKDKSWLNEQEHTTTAKSSSSNEKVRHSSAPASGTSGPTGCTVTSPVSTTVLRAVTERSESLEQIVLQREDDAVYEATTRVLRAIIDMTRRTNETNVVDYITDVKNIGVELKSLLTSVDVLLPSLPVNTRDEIEMAHSILGSDMSRLVHSVKLTLEYSKTLLNVEYRKAMLREANVLAVDSRNLLDAVDIARKRLIKDSCTP